MCDQSRPLKRQNPCLRKQTGVSEFNLDDDLLSHGETPHYHRRCIVSLLSSGWDQVVPTLYGRQEIRVLSRLPWQRSSEIRGLLLKQNPCLREQTGVLEFNLDDDLLSHGETQHQIAWVFVSLLSSGWDQVVPMLYGRQEIRVLSRGQLASLQQIGYVIAFGVL